MLLDMGQHPARGIGIGQVGRVCFESALTQRVEFVVVDVHADVVQAELVDDRVGDVAVPARQVQMDRLRVLLDLARTQVALQQDQRVSELVVGLDGVVVFVRFTHNGNLCSA